MTSSKRAEEVTRCPWSLGVNEAYLCYHDTEWGVPVRDDRTHFEFLILESAQAGLSWRTVLDKRAGYKKAFADFDVARVARFDQRSVERLVAEPSIVRNRRKIESAINNAQCFLAVQDAFGSFSKYIWRFVDGEPIINRWRAQDDVPATSPESDRLSLDLKARGFRFVGSTTVYAHMQATGLVNDHIIDCFRHEACKEQSNSQ